MRRSRLFIFIFRIRFLQFQCEARNQSTNWEMSRTRGPAQGDKKAFFFDRNQKISRGLKLIYTKLSICSSVPRSLEPLRILLPCFSFFLSASNARPCQHLNVARFQCPLFYVYLNHHLIFSSSVCMLSVASIERCGHSDATNPSARPPSLNSSSLPPISILSSFIYSEVVDGRTEDGGTGWWVRFAEWCNQLPFIPLWVSLARLHPLATMGGVGLRKLRGWKKMQSKNREACHTHKRKT